MPEGPAASFSLAFLSCSSRAPAPAPHAGPRRRRRGGSTAPGPGRGARCPALPRHPPPPAAPWAPRPARGRRPPLGHSAVSGRRREKMSGVGTRTGARAHAAGKAAGGRRAYRGCGVPGSVTPAHTPRRGRGFDTPAPARDPRPSLDGQAGSAMRIVGASGGGGEQGGAFRTGGCGGGPRRKVQVVGGVLMNTVGFFFVFFS